MKIIKNLVLLLLSLSFIAFSSCSFQEKENKTGAGYFSISFSEDVQARTVRPSIDTSQISNISLYAKRPDGLKMLLGEWMNTSQMNSYFSLVPGEWELSIELNYNYQHLRDTKTVTITEGEYSSVRFSLSSIYDLNGSVQIKLKFLSFYVNNVTAKLYKYPTMEVIDNDNLEILNDESQKYVEYQNYLPEGLYFIEIKFYSEDGELNTYSNLVKIQSGLDSKEERYISLNSVPL